MKRAFSALLALTALSAALPVKAAPAFNTTASAMAVIELDSGRLLMSENEDLCLPMASTTKIMTALVVLESVSLEDTVTVPNEAEGVEGSSMYLIAGERVSVKDLLYGLMLASGNDAAVALAVHVGGTVKDFVGMMNARAALMGLTKTHFITPNGLHADGHLTTAYELCLITREAMKHPEFSEIVSTEYYRTETGERPRTFKNKNSLLWTYDGAFGVKTGYTKAAGRCLVFGAERNCMKVVGVLLNCGPMFEEAAKLLDIAFENWERVTVLEAGTRVLAVEIENSSQKLLEVELKDSIIWVMRISEEATLSTELDIAPSIAPPVRGGDTVGVLRVYCGDELVGSSELSAANDVDPLGYGWWLRAVSELFAA